MDSFFEKLANSSFGSQSSDHLKLLGKRAAGMYVRKEADSLNDAVRAVVGTEDLNKDQVARVAETANQATWNESFHKNGDNVSFEPADATAVLGELEEKPEVISDDQAGLDYYNDVPNQTRDVDWGDVFKVEDASPEYEALNPARQEQEAAEKTASALDMARFGVDQLIGDLATTGEDLYQMIKQAHLRDGFGILQISQAVGQAIEDPAFATAIMKQASDRLESEGVRFDQKGELQKLAHPLVVNTEHPLLVKAATLEKLAFAYYSAGEAHKDLQKRHRAVHTVLRDKLRGL
jgi:hypothetical protein